jgi:hypothetical protein
MNKKTCSLIILSAVIALELPHRVPNKGRAQQTFNITSAAVTGIGGEK